MGFNTDPTKQKQKVIFTCKIKKQSYPPLVSNNNYAGQSASQMLTNLDLGLILDSRLNFKEHLENVFKKINKTICLIQKFQTLVPSPPLIAIFKSFIRHHHYGDIIYDQSNNSSFHLKLESTQYNATKLFYNSRASNSRG